MFDTMLTAIAPNNAAITIAAEANWQETQVFSLPIITLDEIFYRVWRSGQVVEGDRLGLLSILLRGATHEEQVAINRMLHAIRRGWIRVAEDR